MPRLKSANLAVLALALVLPLTAAAITPPAPAADPRAAAAQLFTDPLEREAFISMMSRSPDLAAAVTAAEASAQQSGGADAGAVAAAIQANPSAAAWTQGVVDALKDARTVIAAGLKQPTPQTDYPNTPLVGDLIKNLHKQNAADLYVGINAALAKRGPAAAPPAVTAAPCPEGTTRTPALDLAKSAAAGGDMSAVTGECKPAARGLAPTAPPIQTDPANKALLTAGPPKPVTDQRTTTGAPPSPGPDKGASSSDGGSSLPWSQIGIGASLGAGIGMIMGFGTPLGIIGGALIGAVVGGVLLSGVLGKLFGGGKPSS